MGLVTVRQCKQISRLHPHGSELTSYKATYLSLVSLEELLRSRYAIRQQSPSIGCNAGSTRGTVAVLWYQK